MITIKGFKTLGLAVSLACLSAGAQADPARTSAASEASGNAGSASESVTLLVKRSDIQASYPWVRIEVPADQLDDRVRELMQDPAVLAVERDTVMGAPPAPKMPDESGQSAFSASMQSQDIGALYNDEFYARQRYFYDGSEFNSQIEPAHRRLDFTRDIRVGVIDSNFYNSVDINYVEGANFVGARGSEFIVGQGGLCGPDDPATSEHGTWVSHIIGATTDNALGVAGVAPNVSVVAGNALGCDGVGSSADVSDAIRWMAGESVSGVADISAPVDMINISLGGTAACSASVQAAIDVALANDISVITAVGNDSGDSTLFAPANCEGVVAVAATVNNGTVAPFSNTGSNVTISAQGWDVRSVFSNGDLVELFGTSFAAPIVTGVVAMMMSERVDVTPGLVTDYLSRSGKPLSVNATGMGAGILDSMLFLDESGIPRERVALNAALDGDRARFADGFAHPNITSYFAGLATPAPCDLVEVDSEPFDLTQSSDNLVVFGVPQGQALTPAANDATIIAESTDERILVAASAFEGGLDYGLARCDRFSANSCSQRDTIRGLDVASLSVPAACQSPEIAGR